MTASQPTNADGFGSIQVQVDGLDTLKGLTHHLMVQHLVAADFQQLHGHVAVLVACGPGKTLPLHSSLSILAQLNLHKNEFNRRKGI